jgi:hypothetical protein
MGNVNGCSSGRGSKITNIRRQAGKVYFVVLAPSSTAGNTGRYRLKWDTWPPPPPPPRPPPPPPTYTVASRLLTVRSYPYLTPASKPLSLASLSTTSFPADLANLCPSGTVRNNLKNSRLRKHVWKLSLRATTNSFFVADTCTYVGSGLDTVMAVLTCTPAGGNNIKDCTCMENVNGCSSGRGSKITDIRRQAGKVYFVVLAPSSTAGNTGRYRLKWAVQSKKKRRRKKKRPLPLS